MFSVGQKISVEDIGIHCMIMLTNYVSAMGMVIHKNYRVSCKDLFCDIFHCFFLL